MSILHDWGLGLLRFLRLVNNPDRLLRHSRLHAAREWRQRERRKLAKERAIRIAAIRKERKRRENAERRQQGGAMWLLLR